MTLDTEKRRMVQPLGAIVAKHQALGKYRRLLSQYRERQSPPLPGWFWKELSAIKAEAKTDGQEILANAVWCLETIGQAQDEYLAAYQKNREDDFYGGWCTLARCEVRLLALKRHYEQRELALGVAYLQTYSGRWQKLYPYSLFISPSFVIAETKCSICGAVRSLRGGCDHVVGELYWGEECHRIITEIEEVPEISIVENPVQKYSVGFPRGQPYNYAPVKNVVTGIGSPWAFWNVENMSSAEYWQRFHGIGGENPCPCGSGDAYAQCCQDTHKEERHVHIWFAPDAPARADGFETYREYRVPHPKQVVRDRQEIPPEEARAAVRDIHVGVEEEQEQT